MNACPFCNQNHIQQIENLTFDLWICPDCHSTFLPANRSASINGSLFQVTRKKWYEQLDKAKTPAVIPEKPTCIFHDTALERKRIPDFSHKGFISPCCNVLHLPPKDFKPILEIALNAPSTLSGMSRAGESKGGFLRLISTPLFKFLNMFSKNNDLEEVDLESIQYERKFAKVLGS